MLKRIFSFVLAITFALSVAACGGDSDVNTSTKTSKKASSNKTDSRVTSGGVSVQVEDKSVLETDLAKSDFKGQSFTFYYWYQYGDIVDRKISLFNEKHNAKVELKVVSGNFSENIAKSIASGSPYDLIANHGNYFPQTIFSDIYEPLDSYIDELDMFNADAPENGGISKTVNEAFTWKGKLYACGSAKSVYQDVIYYNKLMFQNSGLEDPYELWKNGQWTWDKFVSMGKQVTDVANNICFLSGVDLTIWWTMCGLSPVTMSGDTYTENLGSEEIISATHKFAELFYGDEPIMLTKYADITSGKAYTGVGVTDAYSIYADAAKKSSKFGRSADNLGVVPMPTGLAKNNMYPGHAAQGYSAAKGAKEPSLPAAYALFESRTSDSDVGSTMQMPAEIRNYVEEQFAKNGFLGFSGLENSEGVKSRELLDPVGTKIRNGEDVTASLSAVRSSLTRMISDSLSNAW